MSAPRRAQPPAEAPPNRRVATAGPRAGLPDGAEGSRPRRAIARAVPKVPPTGNAATTERATLRRWIAAANTLETSAFLAFFGDGAMLDDPSVGRVYRGRSAIARYFEAYFVGYRTRTRIVRIVRERDHHHLDVHFVGDFPGGEVDGIFDVTFRGAKIVHVRAELA